MKKHNFGAGPGILPEIALKKSAEAVLELNGIGMSILEISHRSKDFEAILSKEFEGYLKTRADFYREEKRWVDSRFWQRRYDYITLDPLQRLKALTPANNSVVFDKVHGNLSVNDLKYLCELCKVARPAQEIVSDFTARRHLVSDRGVILALQQLLNEGLITSVGN